MSLRIADAIFWIAVAFCAVAQVAIVQSVIVSPARAPEHAPASATRRAVEIAWAIGLKYTEGWTRLWPSLITAVLMIASFYFLSLAVRTLPIGTAYAIWTGIGTVGAAILGVILFDEPRDMLRVGCIFLIIAGIAGLKLTSS